MGQYTSRLGVKHRWERQDGGYLLITQSQDVTDQLDTAKAMATHNDGYTPSRELRRAAIVPPIVQLKWINDYGVDPLSPGHEDLLCRLLNSSDWAHLRTAPGRLSPTSGEMH